MVTDSTFEDQVMINEWTHNHDKCFISADARGLFSYVFADFGEEFFVFDVNGEQPKEVNFL